MMPDTNPVRLPRFLLLCCLLLLPLVIIIALSLNVSTVIGEVSASPTIDVWYGTNQQFGQPGNAQQWVNILGNVSDPDGIASLTYTLNSGPVQPLSIGPDDRRLASVGDFNVEIDRADLNTGSNEVMITVVDDLGNANSQIVSVDYAENTWPLPYTIDWSSVNNIQDVAQIVDGKWTLEPGGVRISEVDYDRVLAIGDVSWTDYEVTLPVTIHAIDESAYGTVSTSPGIGVILRWQGHTDDPIACSQPHCGWLPQGSENWYEWTEIGPDILKITADPGGTAATTSKLFELGHTYWFKARAETNSSGTLYNFKVWEDGLETEPVAWTLQQQADAGNLANGSFLLVAHHVDVTLGNITVLPLSGQGSPDGSIDLPVFDMVITAGESVDFAGSGSDPNNDLPLSYLWQFGVGSGIPNSTIEDPGQVQFNVPGTYNVTFTVTNASGLSDPTPASRTVIVRSGTGELVPDWRGVSQDPFNLVVPPGVTNPVLTAADVTDLSTSFVADPFLFQENGTWYMFFEAADTAEKGHIGLATSPDGLQWTYDRIVLTESFHLSYPYVFKYDGIYYMIPETYHANSIRVYQATNFPYDWTFVSTIVEGNTFNDSSVFFYNGLWWMFTSDITHSNLYLYYSNDLTSGWVEHPQSPLIANDASKARPGGRSFVYNNDRIIRVAQKDDVVYGEQVRAFEVDLLTTTDYAEHEIPESPLLVPSGTGWNASGMHQYDPWWNGSQWVVAADGWSIDHNFSIGIYITDPITQQNFTLTTLTMGDGTVAIDPDKAQYNTGEVVTLTATADPGWVFAGWSGDLSGSANPASLSMTRDKVVTATFTQEEYTLAINLDGDGSVDKSPNQSTYHYSDVVTLTATADPGWTFSNWSGDVISTANPISLTMTSSHVVTAIFTQDEYTLAINLDGVGSVDKFPNQATYHYSDVVTLTATADPGWTFSNWSGDATGSNNPEQVTIDGNQVVMATFTQDEYSLAINLDGDGTVDKSPNQATYHYSDVVTLTATADPGWTFSDWSGDATGSNNPEQVTIDGNQVVTATFTQDEYTLNVNIVGDGQVAKDLTGPYLYGDVVTLTATADPGWTFSNWSGEATGSSNPEQVTIDGNQVVTATFTQDEYMLVINLDGDGTVDKSPNQSTYHYSDVVTLTATVDPGWTFSDWSGDLISSDNPDTFIIVGNTTITATFSKEEYTIFIPLVSKGDIQANDPDQPPSPLIEIWSLLEWQKFVGG